MTDVVDTASATHVTVQPLSGHSWAEIGGLDLAQPLTEAERAVVRDSLHRWG